MNFFDTSTSQSAIDRLIQQACESHLEVLPIEQGNQQDIENKPTQPDDDDQRDKIKTSGPCTSQLSYFESDSIQSTSTSTEPTSSTNKKGFSVYDSYKKQFKYFQSHQV